MQRGWLSGKKKRAFENRLMEKKHSVVSHHTLALCGTKMGTLGAHGTG